MCDKKKIGRFTTHSVFHVAQRELGIDKLLHIVEFTIWSALIGPRDGYALTD